MTKQVVARRGAAVPGFAPSRDIKILNLGCGHKVSPHPHVVNIDWSIYIRVRSKPLLRAFALALLDDARRERLLRVPENVLPHNLAKGIPFGDETVDAVFHSNMLEHLDREVAESFLVECRRVLKPGGLHRIVVPDFELAARRYLDHAAACEADPGEMEAHDDFIAAMLEQSVRREAAGSRIQRPLRRWLENWLLGDARRRGETHQWAYDRFTLEAKLRRAGYREVVVYDFGSSGIAGWAGYGLDTNADGSEYAPGSLYLEARA